jgi:hypothetical protein
MVVGNVLANHWAEILGLDVGQVNKCAGTLRLSRMFSGKLITLTTPQELAWVEALGRSEWRASPNPQVAEKCPHLQMR